MDYFAPITEEAEEAVIDFPSLKALREIQPSTFLRAAGAPGPFTEHPYNALFAEGTQTFKDVDGHACLVHSCYPGQEENLKAVMGLCTAAFDVERYRGPAPGFMLYGSSVHRPEVFVVRVRN